MSTPSERIRTAAETMVATDTHGWQHAQTVLTDIGWTGAAVRIAAVQAAQLADAIRAGNA